MGNTGLPVPVGERHAAFLSLVDDYDFTDHQKSVLSLHLSDPKLTKKQIAEQTGISLRVVYDIFYSKEYEKLSKSVAEKEKKGLVTLAVLTLRECLKSQDDKVRLNAALRILEDSGEIKKVPVNMRTENKMVVVWQDRMPINAIEAEA